MVVIRLFQTHNTRRIYVSGSQNTGLVMRFCQCKSMWNQLEPTELQSVIGRRDQQQQHRASRVMEVLITTQKEKNIVKNKLDLELC